MAKCAICEKAVHFGNQVSHSHRRSNKMWKANVKSVRVKVDGGTKKMYVSFFYASCYVVYFIVVWNRKKKAFSHFSLTKRLSVCTIYIVNHIHSTI